MSKRDFAKFRYNRVLSVDVRIVNAKIRGPKEDLGYFKFCFGIVVATFLALVGWIATNYNKAEMWLVVVACLTSLIFATLAVFLNRKMRKII